MTQYRVMVAVLTLLALPLGAGTEQTVTPPELNWTATAPARGTLTAGALGPRIVMETLSFTRHASNARSRRSHPSTSCSSSRRTAPR
jgi:hypothetical protein